MQADAGDVSYSIKSTVSYVNPNEGTSIWNFTEEDRAVGLFMNNSWQSVELKSTSFPLDVLRNDDDGNRIAILTFPRQQLKPGENVSYTAEYQVVSKPRAVPNISETESGTLDAIPQDLKENYTRAEGSWLVKDPNLVQVANYLAGNEKRTLTIIKDLVGWITLNINYTTHEFPFYPNETLNAGEGDCDDQAILFVTLARIIGIPSYLQLGAIYMPTSQLTEEKYWHNQVRVVQVKIGWHGWAMVFIPPWGWLPVDLTYVLSDSPDPLNAIRFGAVVQQSTVQYMNISKVDYVAESRESRSFILENGFYVDVKDEMTKIESNGLLGNPETSIAVVLVMAVAMLTVSSLLIVRRQRRHSEKAEASVSPAC